MPRKTLALILGLVLVTVILFIIAIQTGKNQTNQMEQAKLQATPTPDVAHTVLSMSPDPVEVVSGVTGTVSVNIDPSDNPVTAIQLEILYDPTMLSNVKVTPGPLFSTGVGLINKNDVQTGRYTYAVGISPSQNPVSEKGVAALISFVPRGVPGKQSQIILQPTSLATARGVASSVLKSGKGATVVIVTSTNSNSKVQGAKVKVTPTPIERYITPTDSVSKYVTPTSVIPPQN